MTTINMIVSIIFKKLYVCRYMCVVCEHACMYVCVVCMHMRADDTGFLPELLFISLSQGVFLNPELTSSGLSS